MYYIVYIYYIQISWPNLPFINSFYIMKQQPTEELLKDYLQNRKPGERLYQGIRERFNVGSDQQISRTLVQLFKGLLNKEGYLINGRPSYLNYGDEEEFFRLIDEQADELNSVASCQALSFAYYLRQQRQIESAKFAMRSGCDTIAKKLMNETISFPSRSWLNEVCKKRGYKILSARTLEEIRRKNINIEQIDEFYQKYGELITNTPPELLFNADETSLSTNRVYKVIGKDSKKTVRRTRGKSAHITALLCFNAVGEKTMPFIVLQNLQKMPSEFEGLKGTVVFSSSISGWMTKNLFFAWCVLFSHFISEYRLKLDKSLQDKPVLLTMDGHRSRICLEGILYLRKFNIRLLILPSHMSHLIQAFDVALSGNLKTEFEKAILLSELYKNKILNTECNETARSYSRQIMVYSLVEAWQKTSTFKNCQKAFEACGLKPLNKNKILESPFVPANPKLYQTVNTFSISNKVITDDEIIQEISSRYYNSNIPKMNEHDFFYKIYFSEQKIGKIISPLPPAFIRCPNTNIILEKKFIAI